VEKVSLDLLACILVNDPNFLLFLIFLLVRRPGRWLFGVDDNAEVGGGWQE
jgi:hypothetical protein